LTRPFTEFLPFGYPADKPDAALMHHFISTLTAVDAAIAMSIEKFVKD
jgi:hypothetical protein